MKQMKWIGFILIVALFIACYQGFVMGEELAESERSEMEEFSKYKKFIEMKEARGDEVQGEILTKESKKKAQIIERQSKKNYCGLHFGLNLAQLKGLDLPGVQGRVGFEFGANLAYELTEDLMFSPGIEFIERGALYNSWTTELNYIQFPLMLKYKLLKGDIAVELQGGLYYGIAIARKETIMYGQKFEVDESDLYNSSDMGYLVGINTIWNDKYFFEALYSSSFSTVATYGDVKNTGLCLRGGQRYRF